MSVRNELINLANLTSAGFKRVAAEGDVVACRIGPPHASLHLVQGYNTGDWWAMVVKYPKDLESDAGRFPHFDKRLKRWGDLVLLCRALGITLQEPAQ